MAIKPYLQLVRLPNVFTAAADSLAGWLFVSGSFPSAGWSWLALAGASMSTYAGGIVLNDVFDIEVDRVERPNRPLPSGCVPVETARWLGGLLLTLGMVLALASRIKYAWVVEAALVGCILAYDAGVKRSILGPELMGACRGLNLLLGMSTSSGFGGPSAWLLPVDYGLFVTGITWISRSEVGTGRWRNVALGMVLQNIAWLGYLVAGADPSQFLRWSHQGRWVASGLMITLGIGLVVNTVNFLAVRSPAPETTQRAVKVGILCLVWLHVGLLLSVWGPVQALSVGWLWLPAVFSGRWIYST
jgi:4-hydroxybenzoate polyprenyltransferase